jgi:hypothetical protein
MHALRAFVVLASTTLACSSSELSASENARLASQCSTAPAQYDNAHGPPIRAHAHYTGSPTCAARCGTQPLNTPTFGASWSYDALPSGACTMGTHCDMGASYTQTCDGMTEACNLSNVECECEDGEWRCAITAQGAGACLPCDGHRGSPGTIAPLDAGAR